MSWLSVRARPEASERSAVLKALFELGSQGVHEDGDALLTHFPLDISQREVETAFRSAGYTGVAEFSVYEPVDWTERWKDSYKVQTVGKLRVAPPWLATESPEGIAVTIEPGMAFGTGEHASTRCALDLLQRNLNRGDTVADLGAGSAILSIAAALLGARSVVAIENDPDAMENAESNIRANGVDHAVTLFEGDAATLLPLVAPVRLILANIVSSVLIALLPVMKAALPADNTGVLILSGILKDERDEFLSVVSAQGWRVKNEITEDAWFAVAIQ